MRALVTGGAGFIGSHLVDALIERGDEVDVVDNLSHGRRENVPAESTFHELDIRESLEALFEQRQPEIVFHLAAQADVRVSVERPLYDAEVNVLGTLQVLQAARASGARVVLASTGGAIYGECTEPANEDSVRQPLAPYGTSKLCAEEYLATYNRLHGTAHSALRFGNVYGPRQDPHGEAGVVAIFFNRLLADEACTIFGDGKQTRDYVYVGDVVAACLAASARPAGTFNIGTGNETSVLELYELCRTVAGVTADAVFAPARAGELQRSVLDITRAREGLGWAPQHELAQGLAETHAWFAERDPAVA